MLDSEEREASEDEVETFFLLCGFVAYILFEVFSERFMARMADLSKDGRVILKRLLPEVICVGRAPEVPPMFEIGLQH